MSLAQLSGKVGKLSQKIAGASTSLGNAIGTAVFGENSFLRNEDQGNFLGQARDLVNSGAKNDMYVVGRIPKDTDYVKKLKEGDTDNLVRAVWIGISGIAGSNIQDGRARGVIIDGYDNMEGSIDMALPSQPVMYSTNITNQRVRQANTFKMRVYVSNLNSDSTVGGLLDQVKSSASVLGKLLSPTSRAQKALNDLEWIMENGSPFKVYTPVKVYQNMMIESVKPVSNKENYDMLVADVVFREIVFTQKLGSSSQKPARTKPSAIVNELSKRFKFW